MTLVRKYDEEKLLDDWLAIIQNNIAAKLTEISTQKGDGLVLDPVPVSNYVNDLNDEVLNMDPFIYYGAKNISTDGSISYATDVKTICFFEVVFDATMDSTAMRKVLRYLRALREIVEDNAGSIRYASDPIIRTQGPNDMRMNENSQILKAAWIEIESNIG